MTTKYTVLQFAKLLNVSRRTLYRWIELKLIREPRRTLGGKPYYTLDDLAEVQEQIAELDGGKNGL